MAQVSGIPDASTGDQQHLRRFSNRNSDEDNVENGVDPEAIPLTSQADIEAGRTEPSEAKAERKHITWLCIDLSHLPEIWQFVFLSAGVFIFFMLCSYVEEYLFFVLPKFEYGWYMTFFEVNTCSNRTFARFQLSCFTAFAAIDRKVRGNAITEHVAPLNKHILVAVAMTASRGLTNLSLQYLNYPTQIIFKSCKLITVMIGSILLQSKSYALLEYGQAVMLVCSAVMFGLADARTADKDGGMENSNLGYFIVLISLVADSLHSNTQEKILGKGGAPESEVMVFTNFFSAVVTLAVCLGSGEIVPAVRYCWDNPSAYFLFVFRAAVIYLGVLCFVSTIKHFGVVNATTITTVRKILTIFVSFLLFPKPYHSFYGIGIVLFIIGLGLNIQHLRTIKRRRGEAA